MSEKPKLEFEVQFETKKPIPIHVGRLALGNGQEASVVRLVLMPDGLHAFIEPSRFVHISQYDSDLYYELKGVHP